MSKSSRRKERDFKKLLGTFREMILSDKADLLHVEKVHLALRAREKKKKKRQTYRSHSSIYSKKVEAKNDKKDRFSQSSSQFTQKKKVFTGVFFSLISLLRERYKNWDRSAENDPITAKQLQQYCNIFEEVFLRNLCCTS